MEFSGKSQDLLDSAKDFKDKSKEKVKEVTNLVIDEAQKAAENTKQAVKDAAHRAGEYAEHAKAKAEVYTDKAKSKAEEYTQQAKAKSSELKGNVKERYSRAMEDAKESDSYPMAIVTWCTSFCSSSKNKEEERSVDTVPLNAATEETSTEHAPTTSSTQG